MLNLEKGNQKNLVINRFSVKMVDLTWSLSISSQPCCLSSYGDLTAVATYFLQDSQSQLKQGGVMLLRDSEIVSQSQVLNGGIMHLEWKEANNIMCIDSNGSALFINSESLEPTSSTKVSDSCLTYFSSQANTISLSDVSGNIYILDSETQSPLHTHEYNEYEIWCVLSSDDMLLIPSSFGNLSIYDMNTYKKISSFRSLHTEDVASLSVSFPYIYSGSLDGSLVCIDMRNNTRVKEYNLPGGVWRHIKQDSVIACACMQEGIAIIHDLEGNADTLKVGELVYGLDRKNDYWLGCSFYDKLLFSFN
jgi:hypothetical protein